MKIKASTGRKLRYGGTSVALTALVIAVIIIINVIFSLIVQRYTLYLDLTPDLHFTISEETFNLLGSETPNDGVESPIEMVKKFREENKKYNADNGLSPESDGYKDENVMINILFCVARDSLMSDEATKYVVMNAEELQTKYRDYVSVEFKDSVQNPSRFARYLSSNTETIAYDSVIIECGTEFRLRAMASFYIFEDDGTTPYAYNGEKAFASAILAVTRAQVPLVCITKNHGEFSNSDQLISFATAVTEAGYDLRDIDLSQEDIPEECRILVVFDPKQDFLLGDDGTGAQGELSKLDAFLEDRNSLMVFMNPDSYTGRLNNLEDFLCEWGIQIRRQDNDAYLIRDTQDSIMGNSAAVVGSYGESEIAQAWTESMRSGSNPPKVVFKNSAALSYATNYGYRPTRVPLDEDDPSKGDINVAYNSTTDITVYDLFTTGTNAKAYLGGDPAREIAQSTATDPLKLMTVSVKMYSEQELATVITDSAYVMVCGSTDFALSDYLDSNAYGNSDLLLSMLQMSGREPVPVGLDYKEFANYEMETVTSKEATQYTVVLVAVPIVASLFAGVFVIVRRKNR